MVSTVGLPSDPVVVTTSVEVVVMVPVHAVYSVVKISTSGVLIMISSSVVGTPSVPVTVVITVSVVVDEIVHGMVVVTTGAGQLSPSGAIKM